MYACFKCQPLVPEVTIDDSGTEPPDPSEGQNSNTDEVFIFLYNPVAWVQYYECIFPLELYMYLRN